MSYEKDILRAIIEEDQEKLNEIMENDRPVDMIKFLREALALDEETTEMMWRQLSNTVH